MKAQKEYLSSNISHSFRVKHTVLPYMDSPWHYHPDYELIYMVQGSGKRFVGDSVENFQAGDLIFIGPDVPHVWKSDEEYYQGVKGVNTEVIVIQFKNEALGKGFFSLPELKEIKSILDLSNRGLKVLGKTKQCIISEMWKIINLNGIARITSLLEILNYLTHTNEVSPLLAVPYKKMHNDRGSEKLNKVFDFVSSNFQKSIQLDDIAQLANMSKTAFCRFFKLKTTKTFNQYLTDVRVSYACELLMNSDLTIAQIAVASGYNSQSLFNRQFKALKGASPREYQVRYKKLQ